MTRNLGTHPAQLLNPTISKFWHSSYRIITLHNLQILLSLLLLSHPTISNFYQPTNWNILGGQQSHLIITVLVQHNYICLGYFTPVSLRRLFNTHQIHHPIFFANSPLKSASCSSPPPFSFQAIHPQYIGFSCLHTPKNNVGFFREFPY